jgi:tRNA uridine 5-carbamoylmethylation protein Kti12
MADDKNDKDENAVETEPNTKITKKKTHKKNGKKQVEPRNDTYKRILYIIGKVKTPMNFFVLGMLIAEGILGTITGFSQGTDRTVLIILMPSIMILTIIAVTLLAAFKPGALSDRVTTGVVTTLLNRDTYVDAMIDNCKKATSKIWLSVHTMKPGDANLKIGQLQYKLGKAKQDNVDVKIMMPCGYEKIKAAYQLNAKNIPIKVLSYLNIEDLRYMIIDDNLSIISLETSGEHGSSTSGAVIKSEQLNQLLQQHFNRNWDDEQSKDYDIFLTAEVRGLMNPAYPNSKNTIAEKLDIPKKEVSKALNMTDPKVIFLLGRPCSGKTHATQVLKEFLTKHGYDESSIKVFNDYETLYEWFHADTTHNHFEPDLHGGFLVKNYMKLDECIIQLNNDINKVINNNQFIIVEFARKEYERALKFFDKKILDSCIIIYLDASLDICIQRNNERALKGSNKKTGFVPSKILEEYYEFNDVDQLSESLAKKLIKIENSENGIYLFNERINLTMEAKLESWLNESQPVKTSDSN